MELGKGIWISENKPLVLETLAAEIEQQGRSVAGWGKVVDYLRLVGGSGAATRFDFDDNLRETDEVDAVLAAELMTLVRDRAANFWSERNAT